MGRSQKRRAGGSTSPRKKKKKEKTPLIGKRWDQPLFFSEREGKKKFLDYCFSEYGHWNTSIRCLLSNANSKTPSQTYWICTLNKFKLQFREPQLLIQTWGARLPSGFPTFWLWSWVVLGAHGSCLNCLCTKLGKSNTHPAYCLGFWEINK